MDASRTAMNVAIRPIPIELSSGLMNCEVVRSWWKFPQVHCAGKKEGSRTGVGVLKASETSQSTGIRASAMTTKFVVPQLTLWRGVVTAISESPLSDVRAGGRGAEALDEHDRDDRHADEDEDRDRRADPQFQRAEHVVVHTDRDRPGVISPGGQDEDVVEDPERVQRPEQQRDLDRGLHQRHPDPPEAPPGAVAVHHGRLLQVL